MTRGNLADKAKRAYADWLVADMAARAAERKVKSAWVACDMGAPPPTAEHYAEVVRLRAIADAKLRDVVDALALAAAQRA